jgi:hypothetical protein
MTTGTTPTRCPPVDGDDRADILRFASIMLGPSDRYHAELVTEMAAPLLEWAAQARDIADLRLRMRAMRRQYENTPMAYSRSPAVTLQRGRFPWLRSGPSFSGGPDVWLPQSVITTPGRFLTETAELYAFLVAGGGR